MVGKNCKDFYKKILKKCKYEDETITIRHYTYYRRVPKDKRKTEIKRDMEKVKNKYEELSRAR